MATLIILKLDLAPLGNKIKNKQMQAYTTQTHIHTVTGGLWRTHVSMWEAQAKPHGFLPQPELTIEHTKM